MIRLILAFLLLTAGFWWGIDYWRQMSGKEKWESTKTLAYATMVSLMAVVALSVLVILF